LNIKEKYEIKKNKNIKENEKQRSIFDLGGSKERKEKIY